MANVTINYDAECIEIDLGDLASLPNVESKKLLYKRNALVFVRYPDAEPFLEITLSVGNVTRKMNISTTGGDQVFPIDSINAVVPADLDELYDLVKPIVHT